MSAPSYSTDLTPITTCESGSFFEFSGYDKGTIQAVPETDYFIQGSGCVSSTCKTILNSIGYDYGSGITVPTDGAVFFWQFFGCPNSLDTFANGGQRCIIGLDASNFRAWKSGGNMYPPNPYGGWKNVAIDPAWNGSTPDYITGSPGSTYQCFGLGIALPTAYPSKGAPFALDAVRYGRGELRVNGGESGNYATFTGIAAQNDSINNRWGLFSERAGSFLYKGLMILGYGSAVDFRDANKAMFIDDVPRVLVNFNRIEVRQAGSRVDWTNCVFTSLGTTSPGRFQMVDNADVNWDKCLFKDMDTFAFLSNASVRDCTFLRCGQLTVPGCDFRGTAVDQYTGAVNTSALVWDANTDPDGYLDDMTFIKGANAHHAIEFGTSSPLSMTLRGITFSGFNAADGQNDSVLHIKRTTGTVTIGCVGCTGMVTYKSEGADVDITQGVAIVVHVQDAGTGGDISGARVLATASVGGAYPSEESVGITRSGSTVTVSHASHGMATDDWVVIKGCIEGDYNGVWQIVKINDDNYSYDIGSKTPSSPATGSPNATFAMIHGTTNEAGNISDTRTYSGNQPFVGRVRQGTASPQYKSAPFSGTIDSSSGASLTVQMARD